MCLHHTGFFESDDVEARLRARGTGGDNCVLITVVMILEVEVVGAGGACSPSDWKSTGSGTASPYARVAVSELVGGKINQSRSKIWSRSGVCCSSLYLDLCEPAVDTVIVGLYR
jgi:hypothetical protein